MDRKRSALIIEDDPDFCRIFARLLAPWDLEIVTTDSAEAAIDIIGKREFDYYSIDLQLADESAELVLSLLESRGEPTASRCIVVTSFDLLAPALTRFRVVKKTHLTDLGPHLIRILGNPAHAAAGVTS